MSNITGETIANWQDDAAGSDTNLPQDPDRIGTAFPTSLPAELRVIKSITRQFTTDPVWISYTGLLSAPSPNPAQYNAADSFLLLGDWIAGGNQAIVQLGRMVRITLTDGTQSIAHISGRHSVGANTLVVLDAAICGADATTWNGGVAFSALNPFINPLWLPFDPGNPGVLPPTGGGTGSNAPVALTGDVTGTITGAGAGPVTVSQLQGHVLAVGAPNVGDIISFANTNTWVPSPLDAALHLLQVTGAPGAMSLATVNGGANRVVLQWVQTGPFGASYPSGSSLLVGPGTIAMDNWVQPFDSLLFVAGTCNNPAIRLSWAPPSYPDIGLNAGNMRFEWYNVSAGNVTGFTVVALGIGIVAA